MPEAIGIPLRLGKPLIVTCHDLIPLRYPKQYLGPGPAALVRRMKDKRRYERADRIVCISPRTARDLEEILGIGAPKASVAWLGIDLDAWRARAELDASLERLGVTRGKYVVYAGYSDYRKNIRGMLGALAHARREGVDLELVWAGHLPPHAQREVDALIAEFGLQNHVKFQGFVSYADLIALFRGALAHPFLSRLEGFGLSVAEAMAARCPVIVARDSGADDVAGDAALVVDPESPDEAGQALVRIAREPGLADKLRAAGEERSKLYDYRRMARDYVSVYREVTGA
jgi:glycosyltransferase involved in cell wall biosynthesis